MAWPIDDRETRLQHLRPVSGCHVAVGRPAARRKLRQKTISRMEQVVLRAAIGGSGTRMSRSAFSRGGQIAPFEKMVAGPGFEPGTFRL